MTQKLKDPELDRLVHELNRQDPPEETASPAAVALSTTEELDAPVRSRVQEGEPLDTLLLEMARQGASDLLLLAGMPPVFRVDGRLIRAQAESLDGDEVVQMFKPHLGSRARRDLEERGSADFSLRLAPGRELDEGGGPSRRFRVNLHRQRGQLASAIRALPLEVPSLAGLNLPPSLAELIRPSRGLVLLCGPTGSGKTTTLAALVAEINRNRTAHIITIEDPVEYEHRSVKSVVEHIEVGRDARSFHEALRASLRQDPDVILVGEMRDLETVATALTAAETGHLVLSTLHTNDAAQAVHRIVDVFPPAQQAQIRHQLALSLHAIVVQQLVPRADGRGRIPAIELLMATYPVRHHIRSDNLQKLYNEISLGRRHGMISMEESLGQLALQGIIDPEEARVRASHPDEMESQLR
ncbi:MAG TPA: PilT/PilU family type 4a pilus ATPase [Thermoanaerobaculia bacterium]|nr:PilT/PilU family type 4a pilus ATPase [Thermoanaerobaculia bacterium]